MKKEDKQTNAVELIDSLMKQNEQIEAKLVKAELVVTGELSRQTRAKAFKEFVQSGRGATQAEQIQNFLCVMGSHTRRQIEEALEIRGSSASARLNKLVKDGEVIESGIVKCEHTEKHVVLYSALKETK